MASYRGATPSTAPIDARDGAAPPDTAPPAWVVGGSSGALSMLAGESKRAACTRGSTCQQGLSAGAWRRASRAEAPNSAASRPSAWRGELPEVDGRPGAPAGDWFEHLGGRDQGRPSARHRSLGRPEEDRVGSTPSCGRRRSDAGCLPGADRSAITPGWCIAPSTFLSGRPLNIRISWRDGRSSSSRGR